MNSTSFKEHYKSGQDNRFKECRETPAEFYTYSLF